MRPLPIRPRCIFSRVFAHRDASTPIAIYRKQHWYLHTCDPSVHTTHLCHSPTTTSPFYATECARAHQLGSQTAFTAPHVHPASHLVLLWPWRISAHRTLPLSHRVGLLLDYRTWRPRHRARTRVLVLSGWTERYQTAASAREAGGHGQGDA